MGRWHGSGKGPRADGIMAGAWVQGVDRARQGGREMEGREEPGLLLTLERSGKSEARVPGHAPCLPGQHP